MKKVVRRLITAVAVVVFLFIFYYITLPAINIHALETWAGILFLLALGFVVSLIRQWQRERKSDVNVTGGNIVHWDLKLSKMGWPARIWAILLAAAGLFLLAGGLLSSTFFNAARYQRLLNIEERQFTEDIKEADYRTVPLLDKESASILGNREMGSMVEMVSQFEVAEDYTQLNYQGKPVRVTPLIYADPIKWLTNQSAGIPAYILIDMTTQDTKCVQLTDRIKYSKSEYFNRNLYRHLRFQFPTYIFDDQIFFEIDDEGIPYWICPVKKFNIGLFGGQTVGNVVVCNAITGQCTDYPIGEVPQWIDKVFSAELLIELYDYAGTLKHGFWNSKLGQRDCLQTTNGYNYIALEDDVWVYTGVTSVSGDQSNVGFVLMNQRTMETRYYQVEGAIEDSAMYSAQGQVQHLGYQATFPLLLNIADEPTYFMALKDSAGLVKQYAMVNVQKYQWVAIGSTVQECERNYMELLNTNGIISSREDEWQNIIGRITTLAPVVLDGTTHYYLCVDGNEDIFDINLGNEELLPIILYGVGDRIRLYFEEGYGLNEVVKIEAAE